MDWSPVRFFFAIKIKKSPTFLFNFKKNSTFAIDTAKRRWLQPYSSEENLNNSHMEEKKIVWYNTPKTYISQDIATKWVAADSLCMMHQGDGKYGK